MAKGTSPSGGEETTEFYADGSYAVTRCAPDGRLEVSERVARFRLADRDELNVVSRTVREGRLFKAIDFTLGSAMNDPAGPFGSLSRRPSDESPASRASRPTVVGPGNRGLPRPTKAKRLRRPGAARARSADHGTDDTCSNSQYTFVGPGGTAMGWPSRTYGYRARVTSMPHGDTDRQDVTRGHHAWDYTQNSCGFSDATNFVSNYLGTTSETMHSYSDSINVVDFGSLTPFNAPQRTIALTYYWYLTGPNRLVETDQRYEQPPNVPEGTYSWSNNGAANTYDVWSLASHESGHSLGLGHATSSHYWLTMAEIAYLGSVRLRDLGRGDVLGMRALYP